MRTLLFAIRGIAIQRRSAKVRHLVSSAGLRMNELSTLGGRARLRSRNAKRLLSLGSPSGRRRRRIERFPGTLFFHGDANTWVGLRQRSGGHEAGHTKRSPRAHEPTRRRKWPWRKGTLPFPGLWKVAPNEDKFARTSTTESHSFQLLVIVRARVSRSPESPPWATSLQYALCRWG
jgi:hypothetical protein